MTHQYRFPTLNESAATRFQAAKSQAPKTPRTDTILPEHLLAHTLIMMFTHNIVFDPFVTIFHVKMMFINHQYADRIFKPRKQAVAYTNFLSIASCRIVSVRYRYDLLVTEIRVAKFGS